MIYSDKALSQKIERAEARANADFVETRARLTPEVAAAWIDVGGAYAMFDGVESLCTQTFGLGMFEETTTAHLDEIEQFFAERGAPVFHEVSPLADPSLISLLSERGYQPIEMTNILYRETGGGDVSKVRNESITTRVISPDEVDLWARTSADGWATEHESLAEFMYIFAGFRLNVQELIRTLPNLRARRSRPGCCLSTTRSLCLQGPALFPMAEIKVLKTLC